jgi:hypothetical protein
MVFDFYKNQINPNASEKRLVAVGRISTVVLMILSAMLALLLQSALQIFDILLTFGAGTGLIFILRWFWWRINAWSEISAMFSSGIVSILLKLTPLGTFFFGAERGLMPSWSEFPMIVLVTSVIWVGVTYLTQPESNEVLQSFYKKIQPGGPGWDKVLKDAEAENIVIKDKDVEWSVPSGILAMLLGCGMIYSAMFATGYWIYGEQQNAMIATTGAVISGFFLIKIWKKIKVNVL